MENASNIKSIPKTSRNKQTKTLLMTHLDLPFDALSKMISKNPYLVNSIDNKGETLLSYAIKRKNDDVCQLILTSKTLDLSYQDKNGNTYLHLAVLYKLEKISQILIEKGININKQNKNGKTCLDLAYLNNFESLIFILKNNKVNKTAKNKEKNLTEDLKNSKKNELMEPKSKGRNTKANSKKKDRSNNNSKLTANSTNKNNIKTNLKTKENNADAKNLKINLLFDYGKKNNSNNIKKIESLPTLREMQKTQKNYKSSIKNPTSLYFIQKTDVGKKSKYKKLVKENINKRLTEENSISNKKINIENNTSTDTKFKSGTNKDKISKTNNIKEKEKFNDEQLVNLYKDDDDVFGLTDSGEFVKQLALTSDLNNNLKEYPYLNIDQVKEFKEDDEINLKEEYEKMNRRYIDEVINSSKMNNAKESDENDSEIVSKIYEDDEYRVKFKNNKNSESSDDDNAGKNRSSLNILDNSIINTVLNLNNKNNAHKKTRNNNNNNQIKIKSDTNKEDYLYDFMDDKKFSKTIINKFKDKKEEKNSKKKFDDNNNEFENQMDYQLHPDNEEKYNHNLNELLNINDEKNNNDKILKETNKIKISEDLKEPLLLPEMEDTPENIEELEDIVKNNSLKEFLAQINMQKYLNNFIENGFDDMKIIIAQAQKGIYIKDSELKEAGILFPGDRAKILIRIQEKAGNFRFAVPKSVYYTCKNLDKIKNDINIKNLKNWLKNLRIDIYLKNFISNGYHSLELLFLQMESQSPLTAEILKEEVGIDKIGHRSRIINKLKEDGRSYINKLKTSVLLVGNNNNTKFCDCIIY